MTESDMPDASGEGGDSRQAVPDTGSTRERGSGSGGDSAGNPGAAADQQAKSIYDALGGSNALIDSGLPTLVFVPVYLLAGLQPAIWSAVGVGGLIVLLRLLRRQSLQHAIVGFVIVAIAGFFAARTGQGENFFLPKLLIDAGYAVVWLISILVRWPILGVLLGPILGEWFQWRHEPRRLRAYALASWLWVGLFVARLIVQVPLYLSGQVVALGVAHFVMSWPLWLLVVWGTWLIIRRVPVVRAEKDESAAEDTAASGSQRSSPPSSSRS